MKHKKLRYYWETGLSRAAETVKEGRRDTEGNEGEEAEESGSRNRKRRRKRKIQWRCCQELIQLNLPPLRETNCLMGLESRDRVSGGERGGTAEDGDQRGGAD